MTASTIDGPLAKQFARLRSSIDEALHRYVAFDGGCPPHLAEAIRYALLGPGKRLRPQLVLLAAEACGGTAEEAMPAACAVEMIHAYSLVHDDLPPMDDDDLRRGRPTCHKVFGEAVAILVGDALLARAFELISTEIMPAATAARCCAVLAQAAGATALVGGQAADLANSTAGGEAGNDALNKLEAIHHRKTGALFTASLQLGGLTARATGQQVESLARYGRNIGLAFQIVDDLLDVAGSQASVGKRVGKDAGHGKLTFPKLLGVEKSRRRAKMLIDEACGMIGVLGPPAQPLCALAQFICNRQS